MLDDLRKSTQAEESFELDDDDSFVETEREGRDEKLFLGMRPVERMMLSIFFFMVVAVFVLALLLATHRISF
jgi:hypothetical protein